jgi:hypothetical protein
MLLMGLGPVFGQRREAAGHAAAHVGRHAFAVLKEFHRVVGQPHVELLVNELMRTIGSIGPVAAHLPLAG